MSPTGWWSFFVHFLPNPWSQSQSITYAVTSYCKNHSKNIYCQTNSLNLVPLCLLQKSFNKSFLKIKLKTVLIGCLQQKWWVPLTLVILLHSIFWSGNNSSFNILNTHTCPFVYSFAKSYRCSPFCIGAFQSSST